MTKKRRSLFLCLSLYIFSTSTFADALTCRNPDGHPVSWWVLVKLPNTLDDYIYRDSNSPACLDTPSCWGATRHDLSDPEHGPLSFTLQQLYKAVASEVPAYAMYNDDTSQTEGSQTHSGHAHAKGVVATTKEGGYWLVHSVPRFPRDQVGKEAYSGLTRNGRNNGQSFLCISLGFDQVKVVGSQLLIAHPFIYQRGGFSEEMTKLLGADFESLLKGAEAKDTASSKTLVASNGNSFTSFIKSKSWGKDLYDDMVSTELRSNLFVESWNKGRGTLESSCELTHCTEQCSLKFDVANVTEVKVADSLGWVNHKDHSKWAVTTETSPIHSVCIGDINRQNGQRVRGGGTVCLADENLWKAFSGMVKSAEACQ